MNSALLKRNVCIGLIDGIIIPLVLAAVLSRIQSLSNTIIIACIAVGVAGAITMCAGSYIEGKKYESAYFTLGSAIVIGTAYFTGSIIVALPFIFVAETIEAFYISAASSSLILLVCGSMESRLHDSNPVVGALRVWGTGILAAGLAYLVAGLV